MNHTLSEIAARCDAADMVLVGIGEEFQYDWDILLRNERYQEIEKEIDQKEKNERKTFWIIKAKPNNDKLPIIKICDRLGQMSVS